MRHVGLYALLACLLQPAAARAGHDELAALKAQVAALERRIQAQSIAGHRLPDEVTLLGQRVPVELSDVRQRMEREFYVALDDRATVVLWQKRAGVAFPTIEREIRRLGLPEDLKYVAVIESGLKNQARSWAGAVGPWQFMPATAREGGLRVTDAVDTRRDLDESTVAALKFLAGLRGRFGDWFLALAAYNSGPARVSRALEQQGVPGYWDLALPDEAERYVARVAAAKIVLTDPERYGVLVPAPERWTHADVRRIDVRTTSQATVLDLARAAGTTYRHMRGLNPWITSVTLPAGSHTIVVPRAGADGFLDRITSIRKAAPAPPKDAAAQGVRHRVRSGENLTAVAARYGTTAADLSRRNGIQTADVIHPGQVLRVR